MEQLKVQFGVSGVAYFGKKKKTWEFDMEQNFRVAPGRYAIMTEAEYKRLLDMAREAEALKSMIPHGVWVPNEHARNN